MNRNLTILQKLKASVVEFFTNNRSSADISLYFSITKADDYIEQTVFKDALLNSDDDKVVFESLRSHYFSYLIKNFHSASIGDKVCFLFDTFKKDEDAIRATFISSSFDTVKKDILHEDMFEKDKEKRLLTKSKFLIDLMELIISHYDTPLDEDLVKRCLVLILNSSNLNPESADYAQYHLTDLFSYNGFLYRTETQKIYKLQGLKSLTTKLKNKYRE